MPAQQALLGRNPQASDELPRDDFSCQDVPAVRLLAVPDIAPPFDGDLPAGTAITPDHAADAGTGRSAGGAAGKARLIPGGDWPEPFARLLTEALTGSRPARQILPWTTERARIHLNRLMPAFSCAQRPRVLRVIATRPAWDVVEMTVILRCGPRTRALAVRMEKLAGREPAARWLCTDIEAA